MSTNPASLATAIKASVVAVTAVAAIVGAAATPASAGGTGNTVWNCYGIYWNTDWDQRCGSGGATIKGWYHSTGDCTASADRYLDKYRLAGSTTSYDGGDCRFQVVNVRTSYSQ